VSLNIVPSRSTLAAAISKENFAISKRFIWFAFAGVDIIALSFGPIFGM
jgi:hypothetical protein